MREKYLSIDNVSGRLEQMESSILKIVENSLSLICRFPIMVPQNVHYKNIDNKNLQFLCTFEWLSSMSHYWMCINFEHSSPLVRVTSSSLETQQKSYGWTSSTVNLLTFIWQAHTTYTKLRMINKAIESRTYHEFWQYQ